MIRVPSLICIMNTDEADRLNMQILGRATVEGYEGKCLVKIEAYSK